MKLLQEVNNELNSYLGILETVVILAILWKLVAYMVDCRSKMWQLFLRVMLIPTHGFLYFR
jgi:hypothetical protein